MQLFAYGVKNCPIKKPARTQPTTRDPGFAVMRRGTERYGDKKDMLKRSFPPILFVKVAAAPEGTEMMIVAEAYVRKETFL